MQAAKMPKRVEIAIASVTKRVIAVPAGEDIAGKGDQLRDRDRSGGFVAFGGTAGAAPREESQTPDL